MPFAAAAALVLSRSAIRHAGEGKHCRQSGYAGDESMTHREWK
jgi:hypothetical protein